MADSHLRRDQSLLILVLAFAVFVRGLAIFIAHEKDDLRDAFFGVSAHRQIGGVRDFEHQPAAPGGFQRGRVDDDARPRVG